MRVDELHKPKQALGRVVGIPSPNDSKKTKSMKVLCGVPALPSGKKRKSSAKKYRFYLCESCMHYVCYLYFEA